MKDYYANKKKYYCRDTQETCVGYDNYLKTQHWKQFREKIIKERKFCEICKNVEYIMNVHHISYKNIGKEKKSDVALLCNDCHKYIHKIKNGEITCSDKAILKFVKKPKRKKSIKKKNTKRL